MQKRLYHDYQKSFQEMYIAKEMNQKSLKNSHLKTFYKPFYINI